MRTYLCASPKLANGEEHEHSIFRTIRENSRTLPMTQMTDGFMIFSLIRLPDQLQSELHLPPHALRSAQLAEGRIADGECGGDGAGQLEGRSVR